ncbi:AAA family ATPase [Aeromonas veronii]|uniref:AAA family ATPase n=1 Tax=Aeromonas veronii TaxID=654 RepID=UPI00195DBB66|nr:AAA family ATPase [Aeromonas veronii]
MAITFKKLSRRGYLPVQANNAAYLEPDNWDDFGYKTLFTLTIFDEQGNKREIGNIKIGFVGQDGGWTAEQIGQQFDVLPGNFFSLGQDADYYRNLIDSFPNDMVVNVLMALGDVIQDPVRLAIAENEGAFNTSLMRNVNRSTIEQQFRRILRHEAPLTSYYFFYEKAANERYSGITVEFRVEPNTKPSSNIHILIGRNGVGKTTLLNNMVDALLPERGDVVETGYFATYSPWSGAVALHDDYFAGVVSVAFSAFDPFTPPEDQPDENAGMRYYYIGLKKRVTQQGQGRWGLKDKDDLCRDFTGSLKLCFALMAKRNRWVNAVRKLESDFNFAEMDLCQLIIIYDNDLSDIKSQFSEVAKSLFERMSSGHAIVLLTITKLVETVEEKTLVLLDEPESHLHPPLLSAFTRALSDLLVNRNGVAIIATHSPVVLQEVPKSCVSILRRTRLVSNVDRPRSETFAENVGVLTREIFGLEVSKSGFHDLLSGSVDEG